jgi:hypothetical protein
MTYKIFGMLKRPDGMTFEQFKTRWVEVHVPRVMKWHGIVAYEINFPLNENEPFDGVAAVSFDSREAAGFLHARRKQRAFGRHCRNKPKYHLSRRGSCYRSACDSSGMVSSSGISSASANAALQPVNSLETPV